ncbi:hypothetical protein K458DRAFT_437312 [Lentithecium fluviatile CBS 122367]|uniref:Uncharacterized protein n=1 Tax=Lentithecium fluviatile CBS 122367 TaxID=1168545 RepID=A0A6G1IEA2_9PLEO|nr:hypothetical protein K458DRAFT_437312 [Lentithecium fluviatile CBS 122367]
MKFSSLALLAGLATSTVAQDLLFVEGLDYDEYDEAVAMGFTTKTVTEDEWAAMTTEDFSKFKAIVIPDPNCGSVGNIKFLEDSRDTWSPAVTGNIILIGTDPSYHFNQGKAKTLIDNSIKFAAAGTTPAGVPQTGLYFALSCYYEDEDSAKVEALSYFGDFTVRGNLDCYNKVHLVASSGAMDSLDDASLSDWSCSVHEAFSSYPSVGTNGFQALAIAQDIMGVGSQTFGDGTVGLPYILSRGATPAKCGDGVWDEEFGEECDDGNILNGDGCSLSCKCESGLPKGDGTCYPGNSTTPDGPTGSGYPVPPTPYPSGSTPSGHYGNSTATPTYSYPGHTTYVPPPYVTPACPTGPKIIGVEHIIEVTYSSTTYVPCSTKIRPIYDVSTSILPCYACALSSEHVTYTSTDFLTVETTTCIDTAMPPTVTSTYFPPVVKPCKSCEAHTLTETECIGEPHTEYSAVPYVTPTPHVHTSLEVEEHTKTYTGAYTGTYTEGATSLVTYPAAYPTGTGTYYPTATASGVLEYTGAAVAREVKVAGAVGGVVFALAGLL